MSFILLWSCTSVDLFGQKKEADKYFNAGQYSKALKFYNLYEKIDKRENSLLNRAICYFELNKPDKCLSDLSKIEKMGSRSQDFLKYTAKSLHVKGKFEEAAKYYKRYLNKLKKGKEYDSIITAIKQCGFARNYQYADRLGYADNLGRILNTKNDEERVIGSFNYPNRIYFTSNRKEAFASQDTEEGIVIYDELEYPTQDIFYSNEVGGKWTEIEGFNIFLNTSKNEKLHDFSNDGRVVFFQSGTLNTDDWLLVDTAKEIRNEIRPSKLESSINMAVGDTDVKVVNDTTLLFASENLPGFGGYDLYFITRNEEGVWSRPVNLGPQINSSFDEMSPFLSKNGKKLYFSSNRIESFGGLDIFHSLFFNGTWANPTNVGLGINSTKDDTDFRIIGTGKVAYLTSNRIDGFGGLDIYRAGISQPDNINNTGRLDLSFIDFYERPSEYVVEESASLEEYLESEGEGYNEQTIEYYEELVGEKVEVVEELQFKEFEIHPLYYDEDEFLKSSTNFKIIDKLSEIYKADPFVQIVLISHSLDEDDIAFDLYLSAKRAERMVKEFKKKGIPEDNVILLGVGSNYPMVKQFSDGEKVDLAERYNRRFDVMIYPSLESNIEVVHREAPIADNLRDTKYDSFLKASEGLSYRVKVEESNKVINNPSYRTLKDLIIEKTGKKYTYTLGLFKTFKEAKVLYDILNEGDARDLDIRAYFNNILIPESEIPTKTRTFSDLEEYLFFKEEG